MIVYGEGCGRVEGRGGKGLRYWVGWGGVG